MGEQVIHIGDAETVKKLLNAEHDLVEGKAVCRCNPKNWGAP